MKFIFSTLLGLAQFFHTSIFSVGTLLESPIFVYVISRHGDRTPVDTYPLDPYQNETFVPFGWGRLTKIGRKNQFELGKFLKERYQKLAGDVYSSDILHVRSTDSDRTKMSAQLQIMGLYFSAKHSISLLNEGSWPSIPVNFESLENDKLLLVRIPCPRYYELQHAAMQLQEEENNLVELSKYLGEKTGMRIETLDDIQSLYSTLKAEEEFGLELPEWTRKVYPSRLYAYAAKSFILNAFTREMQKLRSGVLLNDIIRCYFDVVNGFEKRKIFVTVGHDSTIANLMIALKVWEIQVPEYNAMVILELHKIENKFAVKIIYKNSTKDVYHLKIPNCSIACPLLKFVGLIQDVTSKDIENDCSSATWKLKTKEVGSP